MVSSVNQSVKKFGTTFEQGVKITEITDRSDYTLITYTDKPYAMPFYNALCANKKRNTIALRT